MPRYLPITWVCIIPSKLNCSESKYWIHFIGSQTGVGLFPSVFNLAESAAIIANATCGDRSTEAFCKLSLDQTLPPSNQECGICDASERTKAHPISLAIDGRKDTWWQVITYFSRILKVPTTSWGFLANS